MHLATQKFGIHFHLSQVCIENCNKVNVYASVFCLEERVCLQKLLFLHIRCARLWVRLGELLADSNDTCGYFKQRTVKSTATVEQDRKINGIVSLDDICDHLLNGLSAVTLSAVGQESVTSADCAVCPTPTATDDGPVMEFNIPTCIIQSLTCFATAA